MRKALRRGAYGCAGGTLLLALAARTGAAVVVDGLLGNEYGPALKVQTVNTNFGDNNVTNGNTANGSELDAAYGVVQTGTGVLNLFFAGNVETNFNHLNIFIADGRSGQTTLNVGGTLGNMNGSKFSSGFVATYALDINGGGSGTNPPTWFANSYNLHNAGSSTNLGQYTPPSTTAQHDTGEFINPLGAVHSGVFFGVDESNALNQPPGSAGGVNGNGGTAASATDASAVTTGLEISIPLSFLGNPHGSVKVLADINGGNDGFLSNQFLPGLAVGSGDGGSGGTFDFSGSSTPSQFFTVVIPPGNNTNGTWSGASTTSNTDWIDSTNWSGGLIPNFKGDSATFDNTASSMLVNLNGDKTVGQISFNSAASYTIASGSGGTLTIDDTNDSGGFAPTIDVSAGNHTISAPVTLAATTTISATSATSLTISGNIGGAGGVTKTGSGTLVLAGTNSFAGALTVLGGSAQLNTASAASSSSIALGDPSVDLQLATLSIGTGGLTIGNAITTNRDGSGSDTQRRIVATDASAISTISGVLTLSGGLTLIAPAGGTLAVTGAIGNGADGNHDVLINTGGQGGTVLLSHADTYTGLTAVDGGTLLLGDSAAAGTTGTIFVGNGDPTLANTNAALLANAAGLNIAKTIATNKSDTGSGIGTGTRTIGGANTTGTATFSGGIYLNGGAVLAAASGGTVAFTGVIADGTDGGNVSRSVTIPGPGAVVLSAVNTYSGNTAVTGGSLTVASGGSLPGTTNLTVSGGSSATLAAPMNGSGIQVTPIASVAISGGGSVVLQTATAHADRTLLRTNSLTIEQASPATGATPAVWNGSFDLGGNDMIVHSLFGSDADAALASLTTMARSGFAGGPTPWTGTGLISSAANADTLHILAIGLAESIDQPFDGQNTGTTDVLAKTTFFGDSNLDGSVNAADYTNIDNGYGMGMTGWINGDFNYDGTVNAADYSLIDTSFALQSADGSPLAATAPLASALAASAAVPEPASASIVLITTAAGCLTHRRRPRRR